VGFAVGLNDTVGTSEGISDGVIEGDNDGDMLGAADGDSMSSVFDTV
jgi:hypothetical protein